MVIDYVVISLKAGSGGRGHESSFALSNRRVVGGGGNGGKGGDIILKASQHLYDLSKIGDKKKFFAPDGVRGGLTNQTGRCAKDVYINVPCGCLVKNEDGSIMADLVDSDQEVIVAKGGAGGEGNFRRTYVLPSEPGEEKDVILDYRIMSDVALVGLPNSGKTSLVNKLTGKNFKAADYPFTTNSCIWASLAGVEKQIFLMDTPPLKLSSQDLTKTHRFLKHLFRVKLIIFVSDNPEGFKQDFSSIKKDILRFGPEIIKGKKILHLLAKIDTIDKKPKEKDLIAVSAKIGEGIEQLKKKIVLYIGKK